MASMFAMFAFVVLFMVWESRWTRKIGDARLREWALQLHYQLLEQRCLTPCATTYSRSGNKQVRYRVLVLDETGVRHCGVVAFGSERFGVLHNDVCVVWDKPPGADSAAVSAAG